MARANSNGTVPASADEVRDQIAALQADMAQLTKTVGEYGRARTDEAKAAATRKAEELRSRADTLRTDAEAQVRQGYAQAETAVRDNPAAAVGIAAGLGFLVGLLSARR
ncbi:DUF883 family protein [Pseudooceanicola onchidii]|uniref:DUF883 family protein n=1 Tax=Pseudooceanicola onchidii TaxID=2562279 RepID=UPI0010AA1180|nr:DUF883 family protein [Pseudooceanicola onchidii]